MDLERYLERMHGDVKPEEYPYEYDRQVFATLPEVREVLKNHRIMADPLEGIKSSIFTIDKIETEPNMIFSHVCNVMVLIEEAERRGFSDTQILEAIFAEVDK